jgi:hypothetical protein
MAPRDSAWRANRVLRMALIYFAAVFVIGGIFGLFRVYELEPMLGRFWAIACEAPVMMLSSYFIAGAILRLQNPAFSDGEAAWMGAVAFGVLIWLESVISVWALDISYAEHFYKLLTPDGTLSLLLYLGFGFMPAGIALFSGHRR